MSENIKNKPHTLILNDRNKLTVSGVTEVGNFDEENICLYTDYGEIRIKGAGLQVSLLDTASGDVSAQGRIDSLNYSERTSKHISLWTRILK